MNHEGYIEGWFLKADHDLLAAQKEFSSKEPLTDIICFHCQQCVEKYLKAYLTFHGKKFPKTHVLEDLTFLCVQSSFFVPISIICILINFYMFV